MIRGIQNLKKYIGKVETFFMTFIFAAAFVIIMLQAVSRYVFNSPIIWTDEISINLQMIMAFVGIAYGIRTKTHIKVDGLYRQFPKKLQMIIAIFFNILFLVVAVTCIKYGWQYAMRNWNINFGTMPFGKGKLLLAVPVGFAAAMFYTVLDMVDEVVQLFGKAPLFEAEKEGNIS